MTNYDAIIFVENMGKNMEFRRKYAGDNTTETVLLEEALVLVSKMARKQYVSKMIEGAVVQKEDW